MPNSITTELWKDLSADMIVGLPESKGFNAILVVVDRHSKGAYFIPCTKKLMYSILYHIDLLLTLHTISCVLVDCVKHCPNIEGGGQHLEVGRWLS
jgi:hypothetical protein